jgi:hypothetical protein
MKKQFLIMAAGAATLIIPLAHAPQAHAAAGDPCNTWHATMQDSSGRTLTCTHLPDSGHLMYWEYGGAQDSGFKTDPPMTSPAVRPGVQCDARVPHVLTVDPATGNAIHPYGPPGCDRSLPVIGEGQ